jgi:hypothetical protein
MANPVVYSNGFKNNIIGNVDQVIEHSIISRLQDNHVFINTTWLEINDELISTFDKNKTAICYSGPDWENTNCIDIRKNAHTLISENFKNVIHIGNTRGKFYFNFWAEFIRQNPNSFFAESYIIDPNFKKLYMCLNRKPHSHRLFLVNLLEKHNLLNDGYVSVHRKHNPMYLKEQLSNRVKSANNSIVDDIPIDNDIVSLGDSNIWNSHFINVVTETTVHTDVFISEKTWKPIIGLRPFLILGDFHIYGYLKELGFDTFDDLFGTWYINKNWETRAESIIDILSFYKDKDINIIYKKIFPRLKHNRECFIDFLENNIVKICSKIH